LKKGKSIFKRFRQLFAMSQFAWYLVFVGRPNAGKSTLIKQLTRANPIIGKKPGSTRKINRYKLTHQFEVVDVPGWGKIHSRTAAYEDKIKDEIIDFFETYRHQIPACVQVIDAKSLIDVSERLAKKGIVPIDQELYYFLLDLKIDPIVALNKIDKISPTKQDKAIEYFKGLIQFSELDPFLQKAIVPVSAKDGANLGRLRDIIREHLQKNGIEEFERFIKVQ
jgi:small GTP-binding protein